MKVLRKGTAPKVLRKGTAPKPKAGARVWLSKASPAFHKWGFKRDCLPRRCQASHWRGLTGAGVITSGPATDPGSRSPLGPRGRWQHHRASGLRDLGGAQLLIPRAGLIVTLSLIRHVYREPPSCARTREGVQGGRHGSYFKELIVLLGDWQTFSPKGQVTNIFSFVDHMFSCDDSILPL